jgi:hypothetical protein
VVQDTGQETHFLRLESAKNPSVQRTEQVVVPSVK